MINENEGAEQHITFVKFRERSVAEATRIAKSTRYRSFRTRVSTQIFIAFASAEDVVLAYSARVQACIRLSFRVN